MNSLTLIGRLGAEPVIHNSFTFALGNKFKRIG